MADTEEEEEEYRQMNDLVRVFSVCYNRDALLPGVLFSFIPIQRTCLFTHAGGNQTAQSLPVYFGFTFLGLGLSARSFEISWPVLLVGSSDVALGS